MKRNVIVPIRLTEEEHERLKEMMDAEGEEISASKFIRSRIFSASGNEAKYKKILLTICQIKTEFHHAALVLDKTKNGSVILEEIQKEKEILLALQEEVKKTYGGDGP